MFDDHFLATWIYHCVGGVELLKQSPRQRREIFFPSAENSRRRNTPAHDGTASSARPWDQVSYPPSVTWSASRWSAGGRGNPLRPPPTGGRMSQSCVASAATRRQPRWQPGGCVSSWPSSRCQIAAELKSGPCRRPVKLAGDRGSATWTRRPPPTLSDLFETPL
ncbi:hypothetical protein KTR9_4932 (plasmid) [Gordonia sp. KTR9]|nr:hypothetical protein KTR9_4932 [Gordonia sp. KTR9]